MLHCKYQAGPLVRLHLLTAYIFQVLHYKVDTSLFDLFARMARAHSNDYGTGRNASLNPSWLIFEDNTSRGLVAEALSSEEKRVRRGFARSQSWVVRSDRHFGWDNTTRLRQPCCSNRPISPVTTKTPSEIATEEG